MEGRSLRRMAGLMSARLPEAGLEQVTDPRRGRTKWGIDALLRATLLGLMAGCRSLRELEALGGELSVAVRRKLRLPARLADTTLRDVLCKISVAELRACLRRLVHAAHRRKALVPRGLPFGVLSMDGKATAVPCWDEQFVQKHHPEGGLPYGLVRTVTCSLVSAPGRPCIDAIPIPESTNEMGHFRAAFASVLENFSALFRVVTYDAGALGIENANAVVKAGKHYLFSLKGEQRTMYKLAEELLDPNDAVTETVDVLDGRTRVRRRLVLLRTDQNWAYGKGKHATESIWPHARTFLRIESVTEIDGVAQEPEVRLYVSSLEETELTPSQWLLMVRSHWGVESTHHTLDTAFTEDERPWIVADGTGTLAVLVLRRMAYTLLALFRSVTSRGEAARAMRWGELLRRVWVTLVAATEVHFAQLRARKTAAVVG